MGQKSRIGILQGLGFLSAFAGPVTTVPWNGHTGAVSFTYDDARPGQIPNLIPQLDSLNIKATFFIALTGTGGDFTTQQANWIRNARNGQELANHTRNHVNVPADPSAAAIISDMAVYLRALDTVVQSVTFAFPNCNVNGLIGVGSENFVARGCGQTSYAWGTQPSEWMNIQGLILSPTNVSTAITMLNNARTGNTWVVTIVHDVKNPPPDQYSVTPADNRSMLNAGVSNNLWIDTYHNIAAYYRAHFTMDQAAATTITGGWNLVWSSPHPKMPKVVKLRVRLATATFGTVFTVQQGNTVIAPESDGSYIIDFMKLSLRVMQGSTGVHARTVLPAKLHARVGRNGIEFEGVSGLVESMVVDVGGHVLFRGRTSGNRVPLRADQMKGILFLTLVVDNPGSPPVRAMIITTR